MQIPTADVSGVPDPLPAGLVGLDVREPYEWAAGHIEGALHIPLGELGARAADELPAAQILTVCRVGGRSAQGAAYLLQQGYDAVNLAGGMLEWEAAGRPMTSDSDQPAHVL